MALLIFAITKNQLWLALMIGSYLLRPTLASLGIAKRNVDERQLSIHYRSSNIAFVVMIITCVYFAAKLSAEGNPAWETYNMVILVGLAAKALFNVMLVKNPREAATKIIITVGLLMALFGGMGSVKSGIIAVFMNSLLGLVFLTIGLLSKRFPRTIGVVVILATVVLLIIAFGDSPLWAEIGGALLIGVPLILAGICLYREPREVALELDESEVDPAL